MPGISGQHRGRQVWVVVRLFAGKTAIGKSGGERVDSLTSFCVETVETRSVETANVVKRREEAK